MGTQMTRLMSKIFGTVAGRVDSDELRVSYDHPSCSYGQPVLVLSVLCAKLRPEDAATAYGPADVSPIVISRNNTDYAALLAAGYRVSE